MNTKDMKQYECWPLLSKLSLIKKQEKQCIVFRHQPQSTVRVGIRRGWNICGQSRRQKGSEDNAARQGNRRSIRRQDVMHGVRRPASQIVGWVAMRNAISDRRKFFMGAEEELAKFNRRRFFALQVADGSSTPRRDFGDRRLVRTAPWNLF